MRKKTAGPNNPMRMPLAGIILSLVLVFTLSSCGGESEPVAPSFSADLQQQLRQIVEDSMVEQDIPGVIVGIWIPAQGEWVAAFGEADIETCRAMTTADRMRIASNTKTFVATLVLQLADEGRLSLHDPLEKYIQGVPYGNEITLRNLLNMTSGIFSFSEDEDFLAAFTSDPLMELTPEEELEIALNHPPNFAPGEDWEYSDTNYEILGMIVEQVTGNAIEDGMRERIIEPLGLTSTSFPTTPDMPPGHARGYMLSADGELEDYTMSSPSVPWAGGAMISDLEDLRVWVKALATGELLSDEMHGEQLDWVEMPGQEKVDGKYGLGIMSLAGFQGHNGAIQGYNSIMLYLPEADATIVVMGNKSTNFSNETALIFSQLVDLLFPGRSSNPSS
ncbi:MAG: beta-lactamase family protein [Actinobacteria bacterium]|nr:beta-lactamase family protein [Actinomycetota bacterium]